MKLLEIKDLNITYKTADESVHAVKSLNFTVNKQDAVGIVGESGSGKSTMAMSILRLLPEKITEVSGSILYKGTDLMALDTKALNDYRWRDISYVFQKSMSALSPVHRVGDQLADIYRIHNTSVDKETIRKHVLDVLESVNLPERVYKLYPHELSGGMMQRVSIALSLINNPEIVIFDEATTALDVVVQEQVLDMIMDLEEEYALTRIMITHDISVVASTCNKVIVMQNGEIKEMGTVEEVLLNPQHEYTKQLLGSYINIT